VGRPVKIAIVGAGSVYTPELLDMIGQMRDSFNVEELRLYDIDLGRLDIMYGFTQRFMNNINHPMRIVREPERVKAIMDVDFVVTQIRVGGIPARILDETIPNKHGLIGQETTGAGGMSKALRTIPQMIDIANDVAKYNPSAWIINYTNPTGIIAEAVTKYTNANIVSLCGGGRHPGNMLYRSLGIEHKRVRYDYFGLNHFNFSYNITIDGRPATDEEWAAMANQIGQNVELIQKMKLLPSLYLPTFFNFRSKLKTQQEQEMTRGQFIMTILDELYRQYADPNVCTKPELLSKRGGGDYAEMAIGVMQALADNLDSFFVCNVPNNGAIPFLPKDAVIETACMVNSAGVTPITFKSFPDSVWGIVSQVKNYESLTVEAAVHGDRDKALFALQFHPLVMDTDVAKAVLDELLEAHRQYLPQFFPKG
jgi:6-phospho-beta-glucosidase